MDETYNLEIVVFRQDADGHLVLESGDPLSDRQIAVAILGAVPRGTVTPPAATAR